MLLGGLVGRQNSRYGQCRRSRADADVFPHAWGWADVIRDRRPGRFVAPAPPGMLLTWRNSGPAKSCRLRAPRDGPRRGELGRVGGWSPRARGDAPLTYNVVDFACLSPPPGTPGVGPLCSPRWTPPNLLPPPAEMLRWKGDKPVIIPPYTPTKNRGPCERLTEAGASDRPTSLTLRVLPEPAQHPLQQRRNRQHDPPSPLAQGIGRARAYGCGLLTLAPITPGPR
ncbi:type I-E CRISPR-associated protein Cas6/Cse3/CasE [Streptomyces sp. DT195]|uniref:type I-E CRISPR-associated protein Cas6/Cse3/CasE n=1 Tax=Streptomyces sp. DT195 TaxID=3393419 RepID=UPI003CF30FFB